MHNPRDQMRGGIPYRPLTPAGLEMALASSGPSGFRFSGAPPSQHHQPELDGLFRRESSPPPSVHLSRSVFSDPFLSSRVPPLLSRRSPVRNFTNVGGAGGGLRDALPPENLGAPPGPHGYYTVESLDAVMRPPSGFDSAAEPHMHPRLRGEGFSLQLAMDKEASFMQHSMKRDSSFIERSMHRDPLFVGGMAELEPHLLHRNAHTEPSFMDRNIDREPHFNERSSLRESAFVQGMTGSESHFTERITQMEPLFSGGRTERDIHLAFRSSHMELPPPSIERMVKGEPSPDKRVTHTDSQQPTAKESRLNEQSTSKEAVYSERSKEKEANVTERHREPLFSDRREKDLHLSEQITPKESPHSEKSKEKDSHLSDRRRDSQFSDRGDKKEIHLSDRRKEALYLERSKEKELQPGERHRVLPLTERSKLKDSHIIERTKHREAPSYDWSREEELRSSQRLAPTEPAPLERIVEKEALFAERTVHREPLSSGRTADRESRFTDRPAERETLFSERSAEKEPRSTEWSRERKTGFSDRMILKEPLRSGWTSERDLLLPPSGRMSSHQYPSERTAEKERPYSERAREKELFTNGRTADRELRTSFPEGGFDKHTFSDRAMEKESLSFRRTGERDLLLASRERERSPQPRSFERHSERELLIHERASDRELWTAHRERQRSPKRLRSENHHGRASGLESRSSSETLGWSRLMKREGPTKDLLQENLHSRLEDGHGRHDLTLSSDRANMSRFERDRGSRVEDKLVDRRADRELELLHQAGRHRSHKEDFLERPRGHDLKEEVPVRESGRSRDDLDIVLKQQHRDAERLVHKVPHSAHPEDLLRHEPSVSRSSRGAIAPKESSRHDMGLGVEHRDRPSESRLSGGSLFDKDSSGREIARGRERDRERGSFPGRSGAGERRGGEHDVARVTAQGETWPMPDGHRDGERWSGFREPEARKIGAYDSDRARRHGISRGEANGSGLAEILSAVVGERKWASLGPPIVLGKCENCLVECPNVDVLKNHMAGKKHKMMLEKKKMDAEGKAAGNGDERPAKKTKLEEEDGQVSRKDGTVVEIKKASRPDGGRESGNVVTEIPTPKAVLTSNPAGKRGEELNKSKPVVADTKSKPVGADIKVKPALTDIKVKPVVKDSKGKPAVIDTKDKPAVTGANDPKSVVTDARVKLVVKDIKGKAGATDTKARPAMTDAKDEPAMTDAKDEPAVTGGKDPKSVVTDARVKLVVKDIKGKAAETDTKARPAITDAKDEPAVTGAKDPKSVVTDARVKLVVKDIKRKAAETDTKARPAITDAKDEPAVTGAKDPKSVVTDARVKLVVKDIKGKAAETDTKARPAITDAKDEPAVTGANEKPAMKDAKAGPLATDAKGELVVTDNSKPAVVATRDVGSAGLFVISRANDDEEVDIDVDSDYEVDGITGTSEAHADTTGPASARGVDAEVGDIGKEEKGAAGSSQLEIALWNLGAVEITPKRERLLADGGEGAQAGTGGEAVRGKGKAEPPREEVNGESKKSEEMRGETVPNVGVDSQSDKTKVGAAEAVVDQGLPIGPGGQAKKTDAGTGDDLPEKVGGFYLCKVCGVACNSAIMWFSHVSGRKHQTNLQEQTAGESVGQDAQADGTIEEAEGEGAGDLEGDVEEGKGKEESKRQGGQEDQKEMEEPKESQQGGPAEANGGSTGGGLSSRGRGGRGRASGPSFRGRGFRGGARGAFRGRGGPGGRGGPWEWNDWGGDLPLGFEPGAGPGLARPFPGPGLWVPGTGNLPEIFVPIMDPLEAEMRGEPMDVFFDRFAGERFLRGGPGPGGLRGRGRGGRGAQGFAPRGRAREGRGRF